MPRPAILPVDAAGYARHWPAALFLVALLASIDHHPGRLTAIAFASALIFGSWALQVALNVVIVNLFSWWEAAIASTGVTVIVWLQLWLALPGMGFVDEMVGDPRLDAGMLAMALVLLPVATAFMVRLLWHVGMARVLGDPAPPHVEAWAGGHVRVATVARGNTDGGRARMVARHLERAAYWRPYAAGAVLVVGFGALAGLWPPAAQLMVGALIFAAPWLYLRLAK
ncbi:hypothetical protein ACFWGD_02710 [Corynebacterium sp. NPDC060344]|uniref:hypothetical protein n=1 Tax=Corynebacterium sp. NPDC060344 TaxID=3347101 RepID=UPI003660D820